jgi:diguanylate cyclase (GGDEF)-like protein
VLEDRRGRLWVGNDAGLVRREPDGRWRLLNSVPGLANHQVYFVGEDDDDGVWVGTPRGVYRFAAADTVRALTLGDGLAHLESNTGAVFCDSGGRVWIGTVGGLSRYDGSRDRGNPVPPRLVIESAQLGDRTVPFPDRLDLGWSERTVTFNIAMLTFRDQSRAAYRARLLGLEPEWIPLRRSPELRYTNLPPGRHRLQMQPLNESGVEGDVVEFEIAVSPPFWLTTWFQMALLVTVVGIGVATHRWRTIVLRRRAAELKNQVEQRTSELLAANRELTHLASHEPLTGLANRRAILEDLGSLVASQGGRRRRFACILVDLDRFKLVNDRHGHIVGDEVLRQMAASIEGALREGDRVGRYGGDEFLVLLPGADLDALTTVAYRIAGIEIPAGAGGDVVTVTASCGGVAVPDAGELTATTVLAAADERLYRAKSQARGVAEVDEL